MSRYQNPDAWITVLGIGEDGLTGLSETARSLLDQAKLVIGGERHLAMLPGRACGPNHDLEIPPDGYP